MFIKTQRYIGKTKRAVLIVHSVRKGSVVRQKVLKYLGIAHTEEEYQALMKLAKTEFHLLKNKNLRPLQRKEEDMCDGAYLGDMKEQARYLDGLHEVFGKAFEQLNIASILSPLRLKQLKQVVIARMIKPASKVKTAELLQKDFLQQLSVDQIYRLMDEVASRENEIKKRIFETTQQLLPNKTVNLLFYDVTTLYFESQKADLLRDFGYSKDHKSNEVQVVLALATTSEGLPLGYTLFPGNTAEVKTLLACVQEWRELFDIKNIVIVADRAMMSGPNLDSLDAIPGIKYVVAAKLRKLPNGLQESILNRNNEKKTSIGKEAILVQEHTYTGRRLIVSFSEKRARKDRKDRERLVAKMKKKFDTAKTTKTRKLITNNGYRKFIKEEVKGKISFDEDKVEQEARWDGLHGIITNETEEKAKELLTRYRRLWVIEASFRINKYSLEMRPIFHFKPKRIRAHILICYLAFAITRYIQMRLESFGTKMSLERIKEALSRIEISILEDKSTGKIYKMPSKLNEDADIIYRAMGMSRQRSPSRFSVAKRM